jgi:hypothetical protein
MYLYSCPSFFPPFFLTKFLVLVDFLSDHSSSASFEHGED